MFSRSLSQLLILTSVCTAAYAQVFGAGKYIIESARWRGAYMENTSGSFISFSSPSGDYTYLTWDIEPAVGGFTFTNFRSRQKASANSAVTGTSVLGYSSLATPFAVEAATNGTWVIQVPTSNLFWTTQQSSDFGILEPFLQQASGLQNQTFILTPVA